MTTATNHEPATPVASTVESELEAGLALAVPGFEVLDRTLEIGDRSHVHLVGADRQGRLVLVVLAPGDGESAPMRALEALEFASRTGVAMQRHLAHARLDPTAAARVVLVADLFNERTLRRLRPLVALGVEAYELRTLRSQARQTSFLHPVLGGETAPMPERELDGLGSDHAHLAEELRSRLARLDERIEMVRGKQGVSFRVEGGIVAELDLVPGRMASGRVPGGMPRTLDGARSQEEFVGEVVDAYLRSRGSVGAPQMAPSGW